MKGYYEITIATKSETTYKKLKAVQLCSKVIEASKLGYFPIKPFHEFVSEKTYTRSQINNFINGRMVNDTLHKKLNQFYKKIAIV